MLWSNSLFEIPCPNEWLRDILAYIRYVYYLAVTKGKKPSMTVGSSIKKSPETSVMFKVGLERERNGSLETHQL